MAAQDTGAFSWQSLTAFGEAFLADAYDLRQNNAWTTNPEELGNTGWYQRTVCPPKEGSWDLVIGAVNGFGNVWLNQEPVGSFESSCGPVRFFLGSMQADREYRITIQVTYPFDKADICKGNRDSGLPMRRESGRMSGWKSRENCGSRIFCCPMNL